MFNQRRDATFTPQITVYKDPTVTTEGTAIYSERIGSATTGDKIGSTQTERDELEFSLKSNTNYLIKITTLAVGTDISFSLRWTEFAF